jgi:hypothetical protein
LSFLTAILRGAAVALTAILVAAVVVADAPAAQARPATHAQAARLHAFPRATIVVQAAPAVRSAAASAFGLNENRPFTGGRARVVLSHAGVAARATAGATVGMAAGVYFILAMLGAVATAAALTARGPGRKGAVSWKGRTTAPGASSRPVQYR